MTFRATILILLSLFSSAAFPAGLGGSSVSLWWYAGSPSVQPPSGFIDQAGPVVVDSLIEFPSGSLATIVGNSLPMNIDVSEYRADFNSLGNYFVPDRFFLFFTNAPTITSVSVNPSSDFFPQELSFTKNLIYINAFNTNGKYLPGARVMLDIVTLPVPEPSSIVLFVVGLSVVASAVQRRSKLSELDRIS